MTTRLRSSNSSKGPSVNYCPGFRTSTSAAAFEIDGLSPKSLIKSFNLEVNACDYCIEPTDTPRTDRSIDRI